MHTNNEDQRDDENIALATFADMQAWHRPGTTDQNALKEVLVKRAYRQPTVVSMWKLANIGPISGPTLVRSRFTVRAKAQRLSATSRYPATSRCYGRTCRSLRVTRLR